MKILLTITVILAIISSASIGCLVIFEVIPKTEGMDYFYKSLAAIALLGGASALINLVTGKRKPPEE